MRDFCRSDTRTIKRSDVELGVDGPGKKNGRNRPDPREKTMRVGIIGAGFAGVSTAKFFRQFGYDVTVFEKEQDVGGVWSAARRYPGLTTQNGRDTYCLSDLPMPSTFPEWPSGQQMQEYIQGYVDKFDLMKDIRLSTEVIHASLDEQNKTWTLRTRKCNPRAGGASDMATQVFDYLIVANGIFSEPVVPTFAGAEEFKSAGGRVCHTSQFNDLEDARGKHIVVVGYGKSSCDVAASLCDATAGTIVVTRELMWKVPYRLFNVVNYKYLLLTRMGEGLFPYIELRGFERFLHGIGRPVRDFMLNTVQAIVTHQLKLRKYGLVPDGPFSNIARSTVSLATKNFYERVGEGKILVKNGTEIRRLLVKNGQRLAELSNGQHIKADIVVCGTGWNQRIPFLDQDIIRRLTDSQGNFRLYRNIHPVNVPNLAFNGYNSSFFSPLTAEMSALWLINLLMGGMKLPSAEERLALIDRQLAWMEKRTEGRHAKGTNIIPFSMHHVDELLEDMEMPVGVLQRFLEWQRPVKPGAYRKMTRRLLKRQRKLASRHTDIAKQALAPA